MRYRWIVLLIIFIILLTAFAFRYNIEATKTVDHGIVKWEKDRWTGNVWVHYYVFAGNIRGGIMILSTDFDINKPEEREEYWDAYGKAIRKRNLLTYVWCFTAGITAIWLACELKRKFIETTVNI